MMLGKSMLQLLDLRRQVRTICLFGWDVCWK